MLVLPDEVTPVDLVVPDPDPVKSLEDKELTRVKSREVSTRVGKKKKKFVSEDQGSYQGSFFDM